MGKKDPLADYKASERRKKKIKEMGSFNKGGIGRAGSLLSPAGVGALGRGVGSKQKRRKMPEAGLQEKKQNEINKQRIIDKLTKRFNKFKKKPSKPAIPLGKMKKGPKPGSFDYVLQETMKPGYKVAPMKDGGKVKKKKPIREVDFGAVLEGISEKGRPPMKDQRLDDSIKGKQVRFKKAGGKVKKPMNYNKGGVCRGMGAAIRGGNFKGVK